MNGRLSQALTKTAAIDEALDKTIINKNKNIPDAGHRTNIKRTHSLPLAA